MKKFTYGFLTLLLTIATYTAQSQSSNANVHLTDVTVVSGTGINLNVCGNADTITLFIKNSTGASNLTNVVLNAGLASGMHYIVGSAYVTSTISGTTSTSPLTENATDIQNPVFTITNGFPIGTQGYVRFLVQADCNIFAAIGNPIYNTYSLNYKISTTSFQNLNETPQPYNNAFQITNIPQPTWVTGQSLNLVSGVSGCRQYYIQNTTATHGWVNNIQLYDKYTHGLTVVSFGIASTAGGAVTPLTTTITGDTAYATINAAALIAAGFGDSLGAGQRIYITECVQATTCTSGTWNSISGVQWGFCFAGPCQDLSNTAAVQVAVGAANMTGGLDASSVFNKCFGTQESYQVFNFTNSGTGTASNLTFNVAFDTTTYSGVDTGTFQVDTTGTGSNYFYLPATYTKISNTFPACFNATVFKFASGTIPKSALSVGGKVLVRFKMKTCCPSTCSQATYAGWTATGTYTNACSPSTPVGFGAGSLPVATVGMSAKYLGGYTYNPGTAYTIPWNINNINYSGWGTDANAQWVYTVTLPSFFTFTNTAGNVYVQDVNGNTWSTSSVTVAGNVITAKFNFPAPGGFSYNDAVFYIKTNTVACTPASCSSYVNANLNWTAAYVPDRTCATTCPIQVRCLSTQVRDFVFCGGGVCTPCPLDSFSFTRTSLGQPDSLNTGLPNGKNLPAGAQINKAMYKDTMMAYFHVASYQKTGNAYLLAHTQIQNADDLTYLSGTISIVRGATTYNCTLPAPTTSSYTGAGPNDLEYTWSIRGSTLSCAPTIPGGYVYDSTDKVTIKAYWVVSRNVGYLSDSVGAVIPGVAITNSSSLNDTLYSSCGYFDHWEVVGYQITSANISNASITTCGQGTLGASYTFNTFQGSAGQQPFPYEYRNWSTVDSFIQRIPAGYQYVPGTAKVVYLRTSGHYQTATWTKFVNPKFRVSGTDTIVTINIKDSVLTGTSGAFPLSTDGSVMSVYMDIKALQCTSANTPVNTP